MKDKKYKVYITMGVQNNGTEIVTEEQMDRLKLILQRRLHSELPFWEFDSGRMINLALVQTITFMEIKDEDM